MTNYPCPIDFAAAWHSCTAQDASHRGDATVDLAYWQTHAAGYDEHSLSPGYYEGTLAAIQNLVRPTDTLLDVGAGAGRFALPLARCVQQVSALDHAGPMLEILHHKTEQQGITNINLIEAAWETAIVEPHDVVLAAWSLYRLPDMLAGMQKLIAATLRTLIIVAARVIRSAMIRCCARSGRTLINLTRPCIFTIMASSGKLGCMLNFRLSPTFTKFVGRRRR